MSTDTGKNIREKAVHAALELAAVKSWADVSLQDIALKAGLPLHMLHDHFEDRLDIIIAWARMIDRQALEAIGTPESGASPRDRLFDILMARFDALNDHRNGGKSILRALKFDPKQAIIALPHLGRSMSWMLEAAGIETTGIKGAAKIAGLTALYLKTVWVWCEDDSTDMAKTMAALDKNLGHAEQWAGTFGLSGA